MRISKLFFILILILLSLQPVPAQEEAEEEINIITVLRRMFPEATIEFDPIRNSLIIIATPDEQSRIEEMIEQLDIYTPQIAIEAKFIELAVSDINELGIDLDISNIRIREGEDIDADFTTDWEIPGVETFPMQPEAGELIVSGIIGTTTFQAILRALEKQSKANVLSAPRITTLNGQTANIQISRTVPYASDIEYTNIGTAEDPIWQTSYTIEEKDAGIYLEVTPTVPEGSTLITLDIKPTVRMVTRRVKAFAGVSEKLNWPVIDERTTDTSMVINSGETIVLGGLITNRGTLLEKKFPLLGNIPVLGHLFRHKYRADQKTNLLIFVTAYLVSPRGEKITCPPLFFGTVGNEYVNQPQVKADEQRK